MTVRALDARLTQSGAKGLEVKWVSNVTPWILVVLINGTTASLIRTWGWSLDTRMSEVNSVTLDFWVVMVSCLSSAHLTREHSWFAFASASTMLGAEASRVKSSAQDVMSKSRIGHWQSEKKVVEEGWRDDGSLLDPPPVPGSPASGAADRVTWPSCCGGMPQATSPNCVGVRNSGSSRWGGGERPCRKLSRSPPLCLLFC